MDSRFDDFSRCRSSRYQCQLLGVQMMIEVMQSGNWAVICATLLGPVLAVQAQKWIERATERSRRKHWIFETLMATRAIRLDPSHVRALNQIDIEFAPRRFLGLPLHFARDRSVVKAWREYSDILSEQHSDQMALTAWFQRLDDSFIALMQKIALAQGHAIDKPHIRNGIYYPKAFGDTENRHLAIQDALARVLQGEWALKMNVASFPGPTAEMSAQQAKLLEHMLKAFPSDGVLRFEVRQPRDTSA